MPLMLETMELMRRLGDEHYRLTEEHRRLQPRNGDVPVGGIHMDPFFRMECIEGCLSSLRKRKGLEESIQDGIVRGIYAILSWNDKREYQVHRSTCWVEDYLRGLVRE